MAVQTNRISIEGIPADAIKTTRKVLLAMIENLARDELQQAAPVKRKGADDKAAATGAKLPKLPKPAKAAVPAKKKKAAA